MLMYNKQLNPPPGMISSERGAILIIQSLKKLLSSYFEFCIMGGSPGDVGEAKEGLENEL